MFSVRYSLNLVRMFRVKKKKKIKSLGQILEKPCERSRGYIFGLILMKLGQYICLDKISYDFEN